MMDFLQPFATLMLVSSVSILICSDNTKPNCPTVNNVGKSHSMPAYFVDTPKDEIKDIVSINVNATLQVTYAILPGMVQRSVCAKVDKHKYLYLSLESAVSFSTSDHSPVQWLLPCLLLTLEPRLSCPLSPTLLVKK